MNAKRPEDRMKRGQQLPQHWTNFLPSLPEVFPKTGPSLLIFVSLYIQQDETRALLSGVFVKVNHTGRGLNLLPFSVRRQETSRTILVGCVRGKPLSVQPTFFQVYKKLSQKSGPSCPTFSNLMQVKLKFKNKFKKKRSKLNFEINSRVGHPWQTIKEGIKKY